MQNSLKLSMIALFAFGLLVPGAAIPVFGEEPIQGDVFFKPDGTKMFVIDSVNDEVFQFSLLKSWDVSTASYYLKSLDVSSQDSGPTGVSFKHDGTKMFVIGSANDKVYQYSLGTAWDVSTATYDSKSFDVSSRESGPTGVFFRDGGTKMFITGQSGIVHVSSLLTAWDVSTATYDFKSFDVSSRESDPIGVSFKPDGTKMFVIGSANDKVYQYSLGTAWDVSTATYDSKSFDVSSQDSGPTGVSFKPDGTKMFVIGSANDKVYQYSLELAWDVPTASYVADINIISPPPPVPRAPTMLPPTKITKTSVILNWRPNEVRASPITSYLITVARDTGGFELNNVDIGSETSIKIGLESDKGYNSTVIAANSVGQSPSSNSISFRTLNGVVPPPDTVPPIVLLTNDTTIQTLTPQPIIQSTPQKKVVNTNSTDFEKTTIMKFENMGKSEIEIIQIWLEKDISFESFKTEEGWTGKQNEAGVIVFTTSDPIKSGESIKFGIKTDKVKPEINWKTLDENNEQIAIGKILTGDLPEKPTTVEIPPAPTSTSTLTLTSSGVLSEKPTTVETPQPPTSISALTLASYGILSDSTFRLIPEKPKIGSTVRVTGDNFVENQEFDFYVDNKKLESFETNEDGYFMITIKIPQTQDPERVNFAVKDKQGNEITLSLVLGDVEKKVSQIKRLTIGEFPLVLHKGEMITITGTALSGGVAATIKSPDGTVITTNAVQVDPKGNWSYETILPADAPLGEYSAEITDGKETKLLRFLLDPSQTLQITPAKSKFNPGDVLSFSGTALPNQNLEIIIENLQGVQVFSDILQPDDSGNFKIDFPTKQTILVATYVLFAFQGEESEIVFVGIGEFPKFPPVADMDKLNYKVGDKAIVSLYGSPSTAASLVILDPSGNEMFSDNVILGRDGRKNYELDLTGYTSGVYSTVVSRGNAQTSKIFSVGLQTGSDQIDIRAGKDAHHRGDSIVVSVYTEANILLTITLLDPDGEEIKVKETFTDRRGFLSDSSFRVPTNAKLGVWTITATSGPNVDSEEFSVISDVEEGISVFVSNVEKSFRGELIRISGFGATQSVAIVLEITSPEGEVIDSLSLLTTKTGDFFTIWPLPKNIPSGTYTITASDGFGSAETTMELALQ